MILELIACRMAAVEGQLGVHAQIVEHRPRRLAPRAFLPPFTDLASADHTQREPCRQRQREVWQRVLPRDVRDWREAVLCKSLIQARDLRIIGPPR